MDSQNNSNTGSGGGQQGGGGGQRRRRYRGNRGGQGSSGQNREAGGQNTNRPDSGRPEGAPQGNRPPQGPRPPQQGGPRPQQQGPRPGNDNRPRSQNSRSRRGSGRVLTTNQVLVKYDNLLEQHLITRRKYYEYFNRVDERQLYKLEKNFFDSIEHLRRFEAGLEPWQREALEKRKTERYRPDLTYSANRGWNPEEIAKENFQPDENEDPHFTDTQKEAFEEYREDTEESVGSYEDYLKHKGET